MNFLQELLHNKVLTISALSWLIAGVCKVIVLYIVDKKIDFRRIIGAGGMPSSHTATVIALAITTGFYQGLDSTVFAITVMFAIIVIHDAVGVRLETGKQAKIINDMLFEGGLAKEIDVTKRLKEYVGHTPLQAFWGAVVGLLVSILMISILK